MGGVATTLCTFCVVAVWRQIQGGAFSHDTRTLFFFLCRYGGISTCFRKEAGAHGKDTWGIFRVHQFEKVEQFCICEGDLEKSAAMQEEMVRRDELIWSEVGGAMQGHVFRWALVLPCQ